MKADDVAPENFMQPLAPPRIRVSWRRFRPTFLSASILLCIAHVPGVAATLSPKDAAITAKAIGFLDPAPAGGVVAVAYDGANAASKADADAIAALFAGGLAEGSNSVTAKPVDAATLGDGSGYIAVIAAQGAGDDKIMQAAKAHHIPCITAEAGAVQSGQCVMSVQSDPKVEITVNHAAAQATGVSFQSAFRMLIHEI